MDPRRALQGNLLHMGIGRQGPHHPLERRDSLHYGQTERVPSPVPTLRSASGPVGGSDMHDQDKVEEKNHQVCLISRIYASAQRTLISLGTDPDNPNHAQDAFEVHYDANRMIQKTVQSPDFSWEYNSFPWCPPSNPLVKD